jgi:hypothetical protein
MNKDPKAARALLEPKAAAGKASKDELAVLCAMCTLSDDGVCLKRHCTK